MRNPGPKSWPIRFLALPPDEQEAARNEYFNEVVAPDFPPASLERARQLWDERTLLAGHKIRLSDFRSGADHQPDPGSIREAAVWPYLAFAFVPPILSLALGLGLRWTLAGFRP